MTEYGPDPFFDPEAPSPVFDTNQILPKSEGGLIEAVKRAVITALREALAATDMRIDGQAIYVDLEYPMLEAQYPGIWVRFSPTKLNRAGVGHEIPVKIDGVWCLIQEWMFEGRVTLALAALKSKERDRLADLVIANLAFARAPDIILTKPQEDTKQYRALLTTLAANPYVAMTLNTDEIYPGGQDENAGAPWAGGDNVLVYTDSYSFDVLGQFNVKFSHDGIYELARIDVLPERVESVPERHAISPWGDLPYHSL